MNGTNLEKYIAEYLDVCTRQRRLDSKTIKAYRTDLRQLKASLGEQELGRESLMHYIEDLNERFKPRTSKRKVASSKAFFRWMEEEGYVEEDPFRRVRVKMREPKTLPRTVPLQTIEAMLRKARTIAENGSSTSRAHRDLAVMELLFATGIRVSELCKLNVEDVDLAEGNIMIWGKGSKERQLQIGHLGVLNALRRYDRTRKRGAHTAFFQDKQGKRITESKVRRIVQRYAQFVAPGMHVTPHMFRHSFATFLLEEDVDIRYIQHMLGHSSIVTTQIYTDVSASKQKDILTHHHPRNRLHV